MTITSEQLEEWKALAKPNLFVDEAFVLAAAVPTLVKEVERLQEALRKIATSNLSRDQLRALARAALPEEPT